MGSNLDFGQQAIVGISEQTRWRGQTGLTTADQNLARIFERTSGHGRSSFIPRPQGCQSEVNLEIVVTVF